MAGTAAGRYAQLIADRNAYLDRARTCAKLTIPSLFPIAGATGSTRFDTPFQSVGARGVNNLASKLLLTLFPPHTSCFKMDVDAMTAQQMTGQAGMKAQIDKALSAYTEKVSANIESRAVRVSVFEALKQIIVAGNALLYMPPLGGMRVYRLDKYVCKRDPAGSLLELVIKESIALSAIPPDVLATLPIEATDNSGAAADGKGPTVAPPTESAEKTKDLYTHVYLVNGVFYVYQEIDGITVPASNGQFPLDKCPYIPLRFVKVDGENYGRSYIEEYLGDLSTLETLTKALAQFTALASRVTFFVNPNGTTNAKQFAEANNGDVLSGDALKDVTVAQVQKANDYKAVIEFMKEIERRLAFAFLLNTSIQRPGERVTAEEIRFMARELEDALGGVYSVQSQELQLPLINVLIAQLERTGQLPPLPKTVLPTIITGIDALGRGQDLANLDALINDTIAKFPQAAEYIIWGDYLTRRATALGVDMDGLIKSEQQVQLEHQQAQQQQMMQQLGPNAVNQLGNVTKQAMANGQGPGGAPPGPPGPSPQGPPGTPPPGPPPHP